MHVHFYEKIWIYISVFLVVIFTGSILFTTFSSFSTPPSHMEHIDPKQVLTNPSVWKPGIKVLPDGTVEATITERIWQFIPDRIELPVNRPILFRITSADVIHGFEIAQTNVNMMAVPGYVSEIKTTFHEAGQKLLLCNEYCGIGHHNMGITIEIKNDWKEGQNS